LSAVAAVVLTACGARMPDGADPRGTLRFHCNRTDAILEVDETRLGPIGMFEETGILLRPGSHRIAVRKDGWFTEFRLVEVTADAVQIVSVELRAIPD